MTPLVLSHHSHGGYAFNNPKFCGKLLGPKSRSSSLVSKIIRKKSLSATKSNSKSKSTAVALLNAYLSLKNKIPVMGREESAPEPPEVAGEARADQPTIRRDEEILRWTNGIYGNGQFLLVSMGTMLNSGCYLPIIDKNGTLLGDFRKLDDLSLRDWDA